MSVNPGIVSYVIATIISVVLVYVVARIVVILGGIALRVAKVVSFPLRWTWRVVWRWRRRKRRKKDPTICNSMRCQNKRHDRGRFVAPYCRDHEAAKQACRDQINTVAFESEKFVVAERFERSCDGALARAVAKWSARVKRTSDAGFVYIYVSQYDLDRRMKPLSKLNDSEKFFYKIGKTTRAPAKRVREQDGAVFTSGIRSGKIDWDYYKVDSAGAAEALIHAALCENRWRRFDAVDEAFETEWFFGDFRSFENVVRTAAAVVNGGAITAEAWREASVPSAKIIDPIKN